MVLTILARWRKPKAYSVKKLPQFTPSDQQNLEHQISDYLICVMESDRGKSSSAQQIQVPSVLELSDFFNCQVMEVINALYGLRKHYYDFEFVGLDQPVILKIPQTRNMAKPLQYEPAWADT